MPRNPTTTFEPGDEPLRCCAKAKSTGGRCSKPIVPGRRVCRIHGGLGGAPVKHGRYAKGIGRFREAYQDARSDPTLLDLKETLALLDVTVQRAAERASDGDVPDFRERALDLYEKARAATVPEEVARHLNQLGTLLKEGVKDDAALEHLAKAAERLSRRQEKAWSIKLDAAVALNARDLTAVLARFADIVLEESSRESAARIIRRIDAEVLGSGPAAIGLALGDTT